MITINRIKHRIKQIGLIKTVLPYYQNLRRAFIIDHSRNGEWQVAPTLAGIRPDHIGRYRFACQFIQPGDIVLDCACGVGYGSFILANSTRLSKVLAIDKDKLAINYAKKYYLNDKIEYSIGDIFQDHYSNHSFHCIIAFEIIEHVNGQLLTNFLAHKLRPDGLLIISTPNQTTTPFNRRDFPFHVCHYTSQELQQLLLNAGLEIVSKYTQFSREQETVHSGEDGLFNIVVAKKDTK